MPNVPREHAHPKLPVQDAPGNAALAAVEIMLMDIPPNRCPGWPGPARCESVDHVRDDVKLVVEPWALTVRPKGLPVRVLGAVSKDGDEKLAPWRNLGRLVAHARGPLGNGAAAQLRRLGRVWRRRRRAGPGAARGGAATVMGGLWGRRRLAVHLR